MTLEQYVRNIFNGTQSEILTFFEILELPREQ